MEQDGSGNFSNEEEGEEEMEGDELGEENGESDIEEIMDDASPFSKTLPK
jgi:hypothetical protein